MCSHASDLRKGHLGEYSLYKDVIEKDETKIIRMADLPIFLPFGSTLLIDPGSCCFSILFTWEQLFVQMS